MSKINTNLDNFIKQASDLLAANEANLKQVAEQAQQHLASMAETQTNGQHPSFADLQYLQTQASFLNESKSGITYISGQPSRKNTSQLPPFHGYKHYNNRKKNGHALLKIWKTIRVSC